MFHHRTRPEGQQVMMRMACCHRNATAVNDHAVVEKIPAAFLDALELFKK